MKPEIHESSFAAPNATVVGQVKIGKNCRIMYGACLVAEGGSIEIGDNTIVLENAVLRSTRLHNLLIEGDTVIGPHTHIVGCTIEKQVFVATGASVFHGAVLESGSEVRINAVVHIKTRVLSGQTVPIGWIAVGDPSHILPPHEHEKIWAIQKELDFPMTVYGVDRSKETDVMAKIVSSLQDMLGK